MCAKTNIKHYEINLKLIQFVYLICKENKKQHDIKFYFFKVKFVKLESTYLWICLHIVSLIKVYKMCKKFF